MSDSIVLADLFAVDGSSKPVMVEVLERYSRQADLSSAVAKAWELVQHAPVRRAPAKPAADHVHKLVQRLSEAERRAIVEAYVAGASSLVLARELGISKSAILALLHRSGVRMR